RQRHGSRRRRPAAAGAGRSPARPRPGPRCRSNWRGHAPWSTLWSESRFGERHPVDMKFFVDTADTGEIRELAATGLLDGVTTNPSLVAKSGRKFVDVIKEICAIVDGPVSAEVTATDYDAMVAEGRKLADIAENVCVKVPLTMPGLKACRTLSQAGSKVNVTLCFSAAQAILAAKAGATCISPFVGRLDDGGHDGTDLIRDIVQTYAQYPYFTTEVLVASVRNPVHFIEPPKLHPHDPTLPPPTLLPPSHPPL